MQSFASQTPSKPESLSGVDHLVYAGSELKAAVEHIEKLLGIRATPGGQHPGRGTRNALIALGPSSYLEIIGPDPEQPEPSAPRPFGIDTLSAPKLVAWAAKGRELSQFVTTAAAKGITLGAVSPGSRRRTDGVLLTWQYTDPRTIVAGGIVPFFIDWGATPHPSASAAQGASLAGLRAEHPDSDRVAKWLEALGLQLPVTKGPQPALIATIASPRGRVELR